MEFLFGGRRIRLSAYAGKPWINHTRSSSRVRFRSRTHNLCSYNPFVRTARRGVAREMTLDGALLRAGKLRLLLTLPSSTQQTHARAQI